MLRNLKFGQMRNCCKTGFLAIALCGDKLSQKNYVCGEKLQISGMGHLVRFPNFTRGSGNLARVTCQRNFFSCRCSCPRIDWASGCNVGAGGQSGQSAGVGQTMRRGGKAAADRVGKCHPAFKRSLVSSNKKRVGQITGGKDEKRHK